MERIAPLEPPYETPVAETLAAMMPAGVEPLRLFRALAHSPRVLGKFRAANLLDRGSIERPDRELAILRTTARCGSEYEWGVHVAFFARRFGFSDEKIAGTVVWQSSDGRWTDRERAIVRLADELHDGAKVGDDLWRDLERHFEREQILELLALVGFYHTVSFMTNALSLDLEKAAERFPDA